MLDLTFRKTGTESMVSMYEAGLTEAETSQGKTRGKRNEVNLQNLIPILNIPVILMPHKQNPMKE